MVATVIDDDRGILAIVELREADDDDDSLELCAEKNERVVINGKPAMPEKFEGYTRYVRPFGQPEATYRIDYERDGETLTATIEAPPPPKIMTPMPGAEIPRSMPLDLVWDALDPNVTIDVEVSAEDLLCFEQWASAVPDSGTFQVPTTAYGSLYDPMASCNADLVLSRARPGQYPKGLHPNGRADAFVERSARFVSVP